MKVSQELRDRLARELDARGMLKSDLARELRRSESSIGRLLSGRSTFIYDDFAEQLAEWLDVPLVRLVAGGVAEDRPTYETDPYRSLAGRIRALPAAKQQVIVSMVEVLEADASQHPKGREPPVHRI